MTAKLQGTIICPFHDERTPSCRVGGGVFKCAGCGAKGSATDLMRVLLYWESFSGEQKRRLRAMRRNLTGKKLSALIHG